jgi:hypothetical protein
LDLAKALQKRQEMEHALTAFYQAVEADPEFLAPHDWLVAFRPRWRAETVREAKQGERDNALASIEDFDRRVDGKYEEWRRRFPDSLGALYGMAIHLHVRFEPAKQYLLELAARDPSYAKTYVMLADDALTSGDRESCAEYLHKATTLEPGNAQYAYEFARSVEPAQREAAIEDVIERFPHTETAAIALYDLAEAEPNHARRIAYLERLRSQFPPAEFCESAEGMTLLFEVYLYVDAAEAIKLAQDMLTLKLSTLWAARVELAQIFLAVSNDIATANPHEVLAAVNDLQRERRPNHSFAIARLGTHSIARADTTAGETSDLRQRASDDVFPPGRIFCEVISVSFWFRDARLSKR